MLAGRSSQEGVERVLRRELPDLLDARVPLEDVDRHQKEWRVRFQDYRHIVLHSR